MKVRMLTTARGAGFSANEGDEVEVSAKLAADLLNGGYAERCGPVVEAATEAPPVEVADEPAAPKKKRARRKS